MKGVLAALLLAGAGAVFAQEEPLRRVVSPPAQGFGSSYTARISQAIRANILWPEKEAPNAVCEVDVDVDRQGNVNERRVVGSEGDANWCPAVLRAIDRTGRIPADVDGRMPPRLQLVFRGREADAPAATRASQQPPRLAAPIERPNYPAEAQRAGIEGTTVLSLHVLVSGEVDRIVVARSSGSAALDGEARRVARSARFVPRSADDGAQPVWVSLPIKFVLAAK